MLSYPSVFMRMEGELEREREREREREWGYLMCLLECQPSLLPLWSVSGTSRSAPVSPEPNTQSVSSVTASPARTFCQPHVPSSKVQVPEDKRRKQNTVQHFLSLWKWSLSESQDANDNSLVTGNESQHNKIYSVNVTNCFLSVLQ